MNSCDVHHRDTCRLCDSKRLQRVLSLKKTAPADKYVTKDCVGLPEKTFPLDLHLCLDCGHVQLLDILDAVFLFNDDYMYVSSGTKSLIEHFDQVAHIAVDEYGVRSGDLVIDVGSNDGSLLRCFQKLGCKVLGIDPVQHIAERAIASGIPTLPEFLTSAVAQKIKQEHGGAAAVCAFNVYAHTDDLAGMTGSIRDMLASNGIFIFEVSYLLDVVERMLLGTIFHEHMSYHSVKPLLQFLDRHGFELIDVRRNSIQGGSVVGIARLTRGPHGRSPSVSELVKLEDSHQLDHPQTFENFCARLADLKQQISRMMVEIQREGKTVWGYGAARSGTTLISEMDLGNVIKYIVDDSPEKQKKYSPISHIEIRHSTSLLEEQPDYVIILAWIHADRIIQKNQEYLKQGGKFIVCVPDIRVVGAEAASKS